MNPSMSGPAYSGTGLMKVKERAETKLLFSFSSLISFTETAMFLII
jgi:hypothetical protein